MPGRPLSGNSTSKVRQLLQYLNDLDGRSIVDNLSLSKLWKESAKLDSGNGDTGFPDGQVLTGSQFLYDSAAQRSNWFWIQDQGFVELGGYVVLDYDIQSGVPPTDEQIVAVFGLVESEEQPGTKASGVIFNNPDYPVGVGTGYSGNCRFQSLWIPGGFGSSVPHWQWPTIDGSPGASLTSDGSGGLYWTDPATPPAEITDTDTTDFLIDAAPLYIEIPVTVTATQPSIPAQVSLDISLYTNNNNQTIDIRMLVDGTPVGQTYTTPMPRNSIVTEHLTWSPLLPNGNEVITVEAQSFGGQACFVYGATGDPTVLTLLEPGGVVAFSANSQGTDYIIGPIEFWDRFLDIEKEIMMQKANRAPPGPLMPWLDVFNLTAFMTLYMTNNINLKLQDTIDHVNQLETWGIIGPGRAAIILQT